METTSLAIDESKILKFRNVLPAILKLVPKVPAIFSAMRMLSKVKSDVNLSLGLFIEQNAVKYADSPAVKFEDVFYSHAEFNAITNRYAHSMLSKGIRKGDTIIALLENRPEILFLVGGAAKIGAAVSLLNPNQRGQVLRHSIAQTPSNRFFIGEELIDVFEEVRKELNSSSDAELYFLQDKGAAEPPDGYTDWGELIRDQDHQNPPTTATIKMEDPLAYIYTSGTTGMPKAAIIIHGDWVETMMVCGRALFNYTFRDTIYVPLPFYHSNAMVIGWATAWSGGAAIAMRRKFSATKFWEDVKNTGATGFVYIGELCRYLMEQPPHPDDGRNAIRKIIGNGLRMDNWKEFKARFKIPTIYEFYGSSEGNIFFSNLLNLDCTLGMCAMPFAIVKYDIEAEAPLKNEDGFLQRVKKGEAGLLLGKISRETPFFGYTDKSETEKKILRNVFEKGDTYFNTGDLMRDIGFKHAQFVDRIGDTFRWKGENVSTIQIEGVISAFEQVSESAVYGVDIPGTNGKAGMASIVAHVPTKDFNLAGFYSALAEKLPAYAIPVFIRFKSEFEYTETMKLKKINVKKEGFDLKQIPDPLYVCLPGSRKYVALTNEIFSNIANKTYRF